VQRLNYNPFLCAAGDRDLPLRLKHAGYRLDRVMQPMLVHYDHPITTMQFLSAARRRSGRGTGQAFRYAFSDRGLLIEYLKEYWGRLLALVAYGLLLLSALLVVVWASPIPKIALMGALSLIALMWIVRIARTGSMAFANVSAVRDVFWCTGFVRGLLDYPVDPATYPTDVVVIQ
jgi:hypothetical protein